MRVRLSHGNARDINVSYDTYQIAREYESDIRNSRLRRRGGDRGGNKPKLPDGIFRGRPYVKEFYRTGEDGESYYFKFEIWREQNYLDDGNGGTHGFGYFIHIEDAPYFGYASQRLHEFHIIHTSSDHHICWNKVIENFDEANAVMFVWVNRYCDLIDVLKKDNSISEERLVQRANKRHVLPSGTFR